MKSLNFNKLSSSEKEIIFKEAGNKSGLPAFAVEKDWWVVQTLSVIFNTGVANHMVFKGGTSLSKGWNLIKRFSEDIDLAIDQNFFGYNGDLSVKKRKELRQKAGEYTSGHFFKDLQELFKDSGLVVSGFIINEAKDSDQDPRIITINYPNLIPSPGYIQPQIQVEIGSRSLRDPFTHKTFSSIVDEVFPTSEFLDLPITIPTVNPERTFLEKIFLLHEEFHRPAEKRRVERLSRHLYDVFKLSKTPFAEKALNDIEMYSTIVDHRYKFTRVSGVNYNLHQPQTIDPIPVPEVIDAWKVDYNTMIEQMIYELTPPSFEETIQELTRLRQRINNLTWRFQMDFPLPKS